MAHSGVPRSPSHKPKKETKNVEVSELKKKIRELEQENKKLKKDLGRSQKMLDRAKRRVEDIEDTVEPEPMEAPPEVTRANCPDCGSFDLIEFRTPTKTMTGCKSCQWRTS